MPPRKLKKQTPKEALAATQRFHADHPSRFDITDEACDLRAWQTWWEKHFATFDDPTFSWVTTDLLPAHVPAKYLSEHWAGSRRLLLERIWDARRVLKEVADEVSHDGGRTTLEYRWSDRLTDHQQSEIILHSIAFATLNHGEWVRGLAPELVLADLARDKITDRNSGPSSPISCLNGTRSPRGTHIPSSRARSSRRMTAHLAADDPDSPFPAKRSARLIFESTGLSRNAFLVAFVTQAAGVIVQSTFTLPGEVAYKYMRDSWQLSSSGDATSTTGEDDPMPTGRHCEYCSRPETFDRRFSQCGPCRGVRTWPVIYCSRECEKADWKKHKATCGLPLAAIEIAPIPTSSPYPPGLCNGLIRQLTRIDSLKPKHPGIIWTLDRMLFDVPLDDPSTESAYSNLIRLRTNAISASLTLDTDTDSALLEIFEVLLGILYRLEQANPQPLPVADKLEETGRALMRGFKLDFELSEKTLERMVRLGAARGRPAD